MNVNANTAAGTVDLTVPSDHHALCEIALLMFNGGNEGDYAVRLIEDLGEQMHRIEVIQSGDGRSLADDPWRPDTDAMLTEAFETRDEILRRIDLYIPGGLPTQLPAEKARALAIDLAEAAERISPSLSLVQRLQAQNLAAVSHLIPKPTGGVA